MGCDYSKVSIPTIPIHLPKVGGVGSTGATGVQPRKSFDGTGEAQNNSGSRRNSYQAIQRRTIDMDPNEVEDYLQEYRDCEEKIRQLEREDPLTLYFIKKSHLQSINQVIQTVEERIRSLEMSLQSVEHHNESSTSSGGAQTDLRKLAMEYGSKDMVSKTEQEFLTSVNRLEISTTELEMLQQEKVLVESEVSSFKSICNKLIALYNRQDDIAKRLTAGDNDSKVSKLHATLAEVETKKIKISEAFQRWREAHSQIIDACRQFGMALKKWGEIKDDSPDKLYGLAEEVRDDLVTALQCIMNTRLYLQFELPYCSETEMDVLEKALSYIFIDMNSDERRLHAESCYKAFHNRTVALFAWIDVTIRQVIQPESNKVADQLLVITKKIQESRVKTIQLQFPDVSWKLSDGSPGTEMNIEIPRLTDTESLETFTSMDKSKLITSPTIDEILKKSVAGANIRVFFEQNASPETRSLQSNGDIIAEQRADLASSNTGNELMLPNVLPNGKIVAVI